MFYSNANRTAGGLAKVTVPGGNLAVGFGKGKFRVLSKPTDPALMEDKETMFHLKSSDDLVQLEGQLLTLGEVLDQKKVTKPDAKVMYHNMVPELVDPNNANRFSLDIVPWYVWNLWV